MMFGYGFGMGSMWLWGLLALVGSLILIFVIVRVTTGGFKRNEIIKTLPTTVNVADGRTPRQILDERYAKGQLNTEEYRERLSVLGEDG